MDKKNQQSKSQFGTLTAKSDANNDYSQGSTSSTTTSGTTGTTSSATGSTFGSNPRSTSGMGTTSGMSGSTMGSTANQTLTSAYDPNDQYGKKGNQQQQGNTTQAGQKKPSK